MHYQRAAPTWLALQLLWLAQLYLCTAKLVATCRGQTIGAQLCIQVCAAAKKQGNAACLTGPSPCGCRGHCVSGGWSCGGPDLRDDPQPRRHCSVQQIWHRDHRPGCAGGKCLVVLRFACHRKQLAVAASFCEGLQLLTGCGQWNLPRLKTVLACLHRSFALLF